MKTLIATSAVIWAFVGIVHGHPQVEHLKEAYKARGDSFFVPLYWLPETRQTVRKHIPDHEDWVGFELGRWKRIKEEDKQRLIVELGQELDQMDMADLDATWNRIWDWQSISSQLGLLMDFLGSQEGFFDMAYGDPVLRPAFAWIAKSRSPGFDPSLYGSTLSAGETACFVPVLIEQLTDSPKAQRYECFSRLFARIAATSKTKAEQDGAGQSATRSESK